MLNIIKGFRLYCLWRLWWGKNQKGWKWQNLVLIMEEERRLNVWWDSANERLMAGWVFLSQKHRIIKMLYLYSDFVFQVWKEKRDDVMGNCRSLLWEKSLSSMLRCFGKTAHINIIQENNVLILPLNIITHALLFQERLIVLPKRETCYYVLTYSFK